MKRILISLFITLAALAALFASASAHAQLDRCVPAPGTAVTTAPKEVRCWFTEQIDDKQSTLTITDASGTRVDNSDGKVDPDDPNHQQMFATVKTLAQGVYQVKWHAVTPADNAATDGTWYFGVGQVTVPTYVAPTAGPTGIAAAGTAVPTGSAATSSPAATAAATTAPTSAATAVATPSATAAVSISAPTAPPGVLTAPSPGAPTTAPFATAGPGTPEATPTTPAAAAATSSFPAVLVAAALEAIVVIGVMVYLYQRR